MNSSRTEGKSNKKRGLGLGFGVGKAFHLKSIEPNRGLINPIPFTQAFLAEMKQIAKDTAKKKSITFLSALHDAVKSKLGHVTEQELHEITKDILALTIPDILVDINISRLDKMMPDLIRNFSNDVKKIFSQYALSQLNDEDGQRFLLSIVSSKYELFSGDHAEKIINDKINEINNHLTQNNMHLIDREIMAYLLPALLDRMNDNDLRIVSYAIANQLHAKYLLPIADENYFVPDLIASNDPITIRNANKRSLQFFANSSNTHVHFRNGDYTLQHAHIHFEKDGEENEYDLDGKKFDGEIHTVFEWNYKTGKRLMAIGFPLEVPLGAQDNEEIAKLIDSINALEAVKQWRLSEKATDLILDMKQLELSTNYKALFMKYFDEAKSENSLLFHSWGSLRADTYGFRKAGLRFVIAPKPIAISAKQYQELKEIFGEMNKNLEEEDKLDPIDRKAGFRKERALLSASLVQKVEQVKNQQLFKKTL